MEYWEIDEIILFNFAGVPDGMDAFLIIDDDGRIIVKVVAGGDMMEHVKKNQKSELPTDKQLVDDGKVPVSLGGRGEIKLGS